MRHHGPRSSRQWTANDVHGPGAAAMCGLSQSKASVPSRAPICADRGTPTASCANPMDRTCRIQGNSCGAARYRRQFTRTELVGRQSVAVERARATAPCSLPSWHRSAVFERTHHHPQRPPNQCRDTQLYVAPVGCESGTLRITITFPYEAWHQEFRLPSTLESRYASVTDTAICSR